MLSIAAIVVVSPRCVRARLQIHDRHVAIMSRGLAATPCNPLKLLDVCCRPTQHEKGASGWGASSKTLYFSGC
jgi:hypothetical protein